MRIGSASLLVLSAFALAACEGTPSTGSSTSADSLAMCGLSCPDGTPDTGITDANGDSIDDNADGNDSSTDGGNTTNLSPATADVTIALESSKYTAPTSGTSLSTLTSSSSLTPTKDQIIDGPSPTTLTIRIDTNTATNGNWPTPIAMDEHLAGTNAPGPGGNAGGVYHEYRAVDNTTGAERNEVLQVWAWGDSYATQYRNATSGDAPQQAWSFGGNKTDMTTAPAIATYNGRFVATAKSENWLKPSGADIDPNALWRVQGNSLLNADFGTGNIAGTLRPETWTSRQTGVGGDYTWTVGPTGTVANLGYDAVAEPDYDIYNSTVSLKGNITGNTYAGAASLNQGFVSTINKPLTNPMYGGFFGPGAAETTGIFHVFGVDPGPLGGSAGINGDTAGYLTINGAFNAQ